MLMTWRRSCVQGSSMLRARVLKHTKAVMRKRAVVDSKCAALSSNFSAAASVLQSVSSQVCPDSRVMKIRAH